MQNDGKVDDNKNSELDPLENFYANWAKQASPSLIAAVRAAALPHSPNRNLVDALFDLESNLPTELERLAQLGFLTVDNQGEIIFNAVLRSIVLLHWQKKDTVRYRQANAAALQYYRPDAASPASIQVGALPIDPIEQELIFHQLAATEESGLENFIEAFENSLALRRFDIAKRLLAYADEHFNIYQEKTQKWLDGYKLSALAEQCLQTQDWAPALKAGTEAIVCFRLLGNSFMLGHIYETQGLVYAQLARVLGGMPQTNPLQNKYQRWLARYLHAPFLCYRWLSRRITVLPSLYFGMNYQDWVIIRLLFGAANSFGKAMGYLHDLPSIDKELSEVNAINVQIKLADLYHRLDQWSRAEELFSRITDHPLVAEDEYRQATLNLALGRAQLNQRSYDLAQDYLQRAQQTFDRYEDQRSLILIHSLLGDVEVMTRQPGRALANYEKAIDAALSQNDLLAATDIYAKTADLHKSLGSDPNAIEAFERTTSKMSRQAYIARFPNSMLKIFRFLATNIVVPSTYIAVIVYVFVITVLLFAIEFVVRLIPESTTSLLDFGLALGLFVSIPTLLLWLYEFLYISIGSLFVRFIPLSRLIAQAPTYIVITEEALIIKDAGYGDQTVPWRELETVATLDRSIWRRPLTLVSRMVAVADNQTFIFDGVLSHYQLFQKQFNRRLRIHNSHAQRFVVDLSLFRSRWALLALIVAATFLTVDMAGWLDPEGEGSIIGFSLDGGQDYQLLLTSLVVYGAIWVLIFFPLVWLVRIIVHRQQIRRTVGKQALLGNELLLWVATATMIAVAWLFISNMWS